MGVRLSEWRLKVTENGVSALDKVNSVADKLSSKFGGLQDKLGGFAGKFQGITSNLPGLTGQMGGALSGLLNPATIGIGAITALGTASVGMAMDFEKGMAKINTTAQLPKAELNALRDQLIAMGRDSTAELDMIPAAYESIISQTGDVKLSTDILKQSLAGAEAGFTDINVVSGALAQTLSIVGKENTNAKEVLDTLFAAKRVGAGEFKDFATYMPQLIAGGKNLGLSFQTTAGIFAYMTGKGQSAADATMLMQNAFSALQKSEITKGLKGAGINVFDKSGSIRDIGVIMQELSVKMSTMSDETKVKFLEGIGLKDSQARNAFSILTSDVGQLNKALGATKEAAGETDKALQYGANTSDSWAKIWNDIKGYALELGNKILPYVGKVFSFIKDTIKGVVNGIRDAYNNSELLQDAVSALKWLFSAIGDVIGWIADKISYLWDKILKPFFKEIEYYYKMLKAIFSGDFDKAMNLQVQHDYGIKLYDDKLKDIKGGKGAAASLSDKFTAKDGEGAKGKGGQTGTDKLKSGINGINEGGKSHQYITVNIGKLNENVIVNSTVVKENEQQLVRMFEEWLLRSVNGAELALIQQ